MASWFFGQPESSLPSITPLQEQRSKQIASMRGLNPNVVELKRDLEYRVSFPLQGHNIALEIFLPPQFPQEKPEVKVSPPVRHPWVNESMKVVGCPALVQFGVHTDLGRVIQDIVRELTQNPPVVFPPMTNQQPATSMYPPPPPHSTQMPPHSTQIPGTMFNPGYPPGPPSVSSSSISHIDFPSSMEESSPIPAAPLPTHASARVPYIGVVPNVPPPELQDPNRTFPMPAIPSDFSNILSTLTNEQLQELLEREDKILDLAQNLPEIKYLFDQRNQLFQTCEDLAKKNLSYKPELEQRQQRLIEGEEEQRRLHESFHNNCMKQQTLNHNLEPQLLLDNLKVAAADAEHESDSYAEKFLDGKVPLEDFLRTFGETRKTLHLRKVKEERLDHMIRNRTIKYS